MSCKPRHKWCWFSLVWIIQDLHCCDFLGWSQLLKPVLGEDAALICWNISDSGLGLGSTSEHTGASTEVILSLSD